MDRAIAEVAGRIRLQNTGQQPLSRINLLKTSNRTEDEVE